MIQGPSRQRSVIDSRTFGSGIQGKNYLQLQSTRPRPEFSRVVGFILLDHFSLPSFTQALDTLVTANLLAAGTFATRTYSPTGAEVLSDLGIVIRPDGDYRAAESARFDLLVVCGGLRTPLELDPRLKALLLRAAKQQVTLCGLWNGAWQLGQAGMLDGYRCAIHPEQRSAFSERVRGCKTSAESHVLDRNRLTAASPSGAFHLFLEWIGAQCGSALADGLVNILAFEESRFRQVNPTLKVQMTPPLREVVTLMEANIEEPLTIEQLCDYAGRSRRQVERLFREQLDTAPMRYYLELRITEGRRLLQHSTLSVLEVAVACGFTSVTHFSKRYSAYFGYPPSKERRLKY